MTLSPVYADPCSHAVLNCMPLSDGRVLIRSGDKNRPLGGQEILRLASAKSTGDFEAEVVPWHHKRRFQSRYD